jgi:hypothetical protein
MESSWWDQKKHEWLYKQEIRRQQRLARKYAKTQAREAERARREMEGGARSFGQWYAEWQRKRELANQHRAQELALLADDKSLSGLLKRHETKVFWSFALLLVVGLGGVITREVRKAELAAAKKAEEKRVLARINGEPIYSETVLNRLFFAHGASMLQEISEQEIIRQAAEKADIQLASDEILQIEAELKIRGQPQVWKPRLEAQTLLRKLVLKSVTPEKRRQVYEDFRKELKTYSLLSNTFDSLENAKAFLQATTDGKELDEACLKFAREPRPQQFGKFTEAQLDTLLGPSLRHAITQAKAGTYCNPISRNGKIIVLRLDKVFTDMKDVEEQIDTFIVNSETPQFLFNLVTESAIESPFIDPAVSDFKSGTPGPFETPKPSISPQAIPDK